MSVRMFVRIYLWVVSIGALAVVMGSAQVEMDWRAAALIGGYVLAAAAGYYAWVRCPRCREIIWPQEVAPFQRTPSTCQTCNADFRRVLWKA